MFVNVYKEITMSNDLKFLYQNTCDSTCKINNWNSNVMFLEKHILGYLAQKDELKPSRSLFSCEARVKNKSKIEGNGMGSVI